MGLAESDTVLHEEGLVCFLRSHKKKVNLVLGHRRADVRRNTVRHIVRRGAPVPVCVAGVCIINMSAGLDKARAEGLLDSFVRGL